MQNLISRARRLLLPLEIALCVVGAVAFVLAMLNDFDSTIGHFSATSIAYPIAVVAAVLAALLGIVSFLLFRRDHIFETLPAENPLTLFGAIFSALLAFANLLTFAIDYVRFGANFSTFEMLATVLLPFLAISMILSLSAKTRYGSLRKISALFAVVAFNFALYARYFNFTLPLNSPIRHFTTVTEAVLLIYLLSEARLSFGAGHPRISPAFTIAASAAAVGLSGYAIGALVASLAVPMLDNPNPDLVTLSLYIGLGVHASGRLCAAFASLADAPVDEA